MRAVGILLDITIHDEMQAVILDLCWNSTLELTLGCEDWERGEQRMRGYCR